MSTHTAQNTHKHTYDIIWLHMKTLSFCIIIYSLWGCWNTCSKINKKHVYTGHFHLHLAVSLCNRSDVNLSSCVLFFLVQLSFEYDNMPRVFLYLYLLFTVNVYSILLWSLKYQSERDSLLIFTQEHRVSLDHQILFLCWSTSIQKFLLMMTLWNLLLKLFEENTNVHSSLGVQDADLWEQRNREDI